MRLTWVAWIGVAAIAVAGAAAVHVWANRSFDEADADLRRAIARAAEARDDLEIDAQVTSATLTSAGQVVDSASDVMVDVGARDALASTLAQVTETVADAEEVLGTPLPTSPGKPLWAWELLGLREELQLRAAAATEATSLAEGSADAVTSGAAVLDEAGVALFATVAPAAAELEAANISARTIVVLDFRDAAYAAGSMKRLGSGAAVAFATYADRTQVLVESAASELAEKAGPLYATRLEIEAYARSIAGGVVLDFDWKDVVAGIGGDAGIGGTATWATPRGGFSTITLSHSVAWWWPSADARALVAHEVGHAITSKCHELFDSEDAEANEEWATAWAISMGHTADGNGTQAYGAPSQKMIDVASTCR